MGHALAAPSDLDATASSVSCSSVRPSKEMLARTSQSTPSTGALISGSLVLGLSLSHVENAAPILGKLLAVIPTSTTRKTDRLRLRRKPGRRATTIRPPVFGRSKKL